mmetsp:Transcript_9793/g.10883  ORF Transcript_9793/g.10883 Transcript_9793/m.10883 type:complete len:351 (-) Transcript_9793:300-1352(-)
MSGSTTMTMMTNIRTTGANDDSNPQQGGVSSPSQQATTVSHQQGTTRRGPNSGTSKPPSSKKDERKLFVGGLPSNVTIVEFRSFFGQFGKLIDSVVMFDRDSGRSRGFGFVTYEDSMVCRNLLMMGNEGEDPNDAMKLTGRVEMQGKVCEMKAATPRERGSNYYNRRKEISRRNNFNRMHQFSGVPYNGGGGAHCQQSQYGPPSQHGGGGNMYGHNLVFAPGGVMYYPPTLQQQYDFMTATTAAHHHYHQYPMDFASPLMNPAAPMVINPQLKNAVVPPFVIPMGAPMVHFHPPSPPNPTLMQQQLLGVTPIENNQNIPPVDNAEHKQQEINGTAATTESEEKNNYLEQI